MNRKHLNYVRLQEWWGHILPPILLFYYMGIFPRLPHTNHLFISLATLMAVSILTALAGYFINDLFDIEEDARAGKKNFVAGLSQLYRILFLPALFLVLGCILFFYSYTTGMGEWKAILFIFGANMLLFLLYSAPPIRLKRSMFAAPVMDALYSGTLFYLLALYLPGKTFIKDSWIVLLPVLLWGFFKGLRNYLTHLCDDKAHDERSASATLATRYGTHKVQLAANAIFPVEVACLLACLLLLVPAYAPSAICIIFLLYWIRHMYKQPAVKYAALNDLHEVWLPMAVLGMIVYTDTKLFLLLIAHFLLFPYHLYKIYCVFDRLYFYTVFRWVGPLRKK